MSLTLLTLPTMKSGQTAKLSSLYCAIGLALMPAAALVSTPAIAQQTEQVAQQFNIPAGSMAQVLRSFASQAGISLSFSDKLVNQLSSKGLKGNYSIQAGLTKLLTETSLNYKASGKNAFIIEKRRVNTLATAQVSDSTLGSNTEGTGSYTTGSMSSATGLNISMRDTPQSVSVITSQLMLDQDLRTLADVVNTTAGLSLKERDSARLDFSARGFAISNYQIDGITMEMSDAGDADQSTAIYERVEIVRGATGLLTGAGNPSAAINLVRKRAHSKEFMANVSVDAGSWSKYNTKADITSPLNSDGSVRARFVAEYEQADSYVDLAGSERSIFYGVVDADLTKNTYLSVGMSHQNNKPKGTTWGGLPTWYDDGSRTDLDSSQITGTNWTYWDTSFTNYFANVTHTFDNNWQLKVNFNQVNFELDRQLLYVYGTLNKETGLGLDYYPSKADANSKQTDFNIQLSGDYQWLRRSHELVFGFSDNSYQYTGYGNDSDGLGEGGDFTQWDGTITEPTWSNREQNINKKRKQNGFYAATRISLTDSFKAILGGRLSNWDEKGSMWGTALDYGDVGIFTPYAGLLYDINTNHSVYASYTEIFKPQEAQDINNNYLDPITGTNYELGLKSEFFTGALTTSIALFKIEQANFAIEDQTNSTPDRTIYYADTANSEGFEAEVIGELSPNWNISLSYSQFTIEDPQGNTILTEQPRKLAKFYTSYNFKGMLESLTLAGGVNWQDSNYTDIEGGNPITEKPETVEQEAYALVSLMAKYDITEQLSTQLNIENLLDKEYYSQIGFYNHHAFGKPRSINLNLSYQF